MAVPKRRTSRSKRNMRRAQPRQGDAAPNIVPCAQLRRGRRPAPRLRVVRALQGPEVKRRRNDRERPRSQLSMAKPSRCP